MAYKENWDSVHAFVNSSPEKDLSEKGIEQTNGICKNVGRGRKIKWKKAFNYWFFLKQESEECSWTTGHADSAGFMKAKHPSPVVNKDRTDAWPRW